MTETYRVVAHCNICFNREEVRVFFLNAKGQAVSPADIVNTTTTGTTTTGATTTTAATTTTTNGGTTTTTTTTPLSIYHPDVDRYPGSVRMWQATMQGNGVDRLTRLAVKVIGVNVPAFIYGNATMEFAVDLYKTLPQEQYDGHFMTLYSSWAQYSGYFHGLWVRADSGTFSSTTYISTPDGNGGWITHEGDDDYRYDTYVVEVTEEYWRWP